MATRRLIDFTAEGNVPDFHIIVGDVEFLVERAVLIKACKYFEKLFAVEMQEKIKGEITLVDEDPRVMQAIIFFCYRGVYHHEDNDCQTPDLLIFNALIYARAEFFQCQALKQVARDKFEARTKAHFAAIPFVKALPAVYSTVDTDRELRAIASQASIHHMAELVATPEFETTLAGNPKIALDFFSALAAHIDSTVAQLPVWKKLARIQYKCSNCGEALLFAKRIGNLYCPHCGKGALQLQGMLFVGK